VPWEDAHDRSTDQGLEVAGKTPEQLAETAARHPDRATRDAAYAALLGSVPLPVGPLGGVLVDVPSVVERVERVRALEPYAALGALPVLERAATSDASGLVRGAACRTLGAGGAEAVPPLLAALREAIGRDEHRRSGLGRDPVTEAVRSLGGLGEVDALVALAEVHGVAAFHTRVAWALRWAEREDELVRLVREGAGDPPRLARASLAAEAARVLVARERVDEAIAGVVATHARALSMRVRALAAVHAPGAHAVQAAASLLEAPEPALRTAAATLLGRAGDAGRACLIVRAEARLPAPSEAWWTLVDLAPSWCAQQLAQTGNLSAMLALLPADDASPGAAQLLEEVAARRLDPRVRGAAVRRLAADAAPGRAAAAASWLLALRTLRAEPGSVTTDERGWAFASLDHLEGVLQPTPSLQRAAGVWAGSQIGHADRVAKAISEVLDPGTPLDPRAHAGLLFDPDPGVRLGAVVGLCAYPHPGSVEPLARRALRESDPVLVLWGALAAWAGVHAASGAPGSGAAAALAGLESARPELRGPAEAFRGDEPPSSEAEDRLAGLLALDDDGRLRALVELSLAHPGSRLSRAQARELSRALGRRGLGVRLVALLQDSERPGRLRRALRLARRGASGAVRGVGGPRREPVLDWRVDEGLHAPAAPAPAASEEDDEDVYDGPSWDSGHDSGFLDVPPSVPALERSRAVREIPPLAVRLVEQMCLVGEDEGGDVGSTTLQSSLSNDQLAVLGERVEAGWAVRWRRLFGEVPPLRWPEGEPLDPWSPSVLAGAEIFREVLQLRGASVLVGDPGSALLAALRPVLARPLDDRPDLDHLGQLLRTFGQLFPAHCDRLLLERASHHADWRVPLFFAWYAHPSRLERYPWDPPPPTALDLHRAASRSALCERLAEELDELPAVDAAVWQQRLSWAQAPPWVRRLRRPVRGSEPDRGADLGRAAPLLALGSLTLRALPYPSFRVVARPGLSLAALAAENQDKLRELFLVLAHLRKLLEGGELDALLELVWTRDCVIREPWVLDRGRDQLPPAVDEAGARPVVPSPPGPFEDALYGPSGAPSWWDFPSPDLPGRTSVLRQLKDDARAYIVLRTERPGRVRIGRRTLRRVWRREEADRIADLAELGAEHGTELLVEGLVQGLLVHLVDRAAGSETHRARDKRAAVRGLRLLTLIWSFETPSWLERAVPQPVLFDAAEPWLDEAETRQAVDLLARVVRQTPSELAQALGLPEEQSLPMLPGGARCVFEQEAQRLLDQLTPRAGVETDSTAEATVFECRPLSKVEALGRGDLGGDCSSGTVPFRCLSPHHTYYGIWRNGEQQRGYLTVYEAWARQPDGSSAPTLCLETINAPLPLFDAIQLDLVHLLEAVAQSRGLGARLALVTEWWAWNYLNGESLRCARPSRAGHETDLAPADPWAWSLYEQLMPDEASTYTSFRSSSRCRLMQQTQADLDRLQPENVEEAKRLGALPRCMVQPTAWEGEEVRGFISGWPGAAD